MSDKDEPRPQLETQNLNLGPATAASGTSSIVTNSRSLNFEAGLTGNGQFSSLDSGWEEATPWYSDQIPEFNVTLTGVNEQSYASTMSILGVEILNEGYGVSVDDIVSEQQMTYVARGVAPWTRIRGAVFQKGSGKQYIPTRKAGL